jgi:hypothetical protein
MLLHTAGVDEPLQYRLSLDVIRAKLTESRGDLLGRFIEFWCQKNCVSEWRVETTNHSLTVWFDLPRDVVLFKLSDEFDWFSETIFPSFEHTPMLAVDLRGHANFCAA